MPVRPLAEMTWEEAREVQAEPWIGLLPVGAIEAHGPHLPLRADGIIAEGWALEVARRLEARGLKSLVLPTIDYTPAPFAQGFPGTVSISPETLTRLVVDVARAATAGGARLLLVCNAHLDPAHRSALRGAVRRARAAGSVIECPDLTRKPLAVRLTEEFQSGACHAGRYETSIVMAAAPELVRDDVRRELAPNPASLSDAIGKGMTTFLQAGGPHAYFGFPADAGVEEGRETLRTLGAIGEEAVLAYLGVAESGRDSVAGRPEATSSKGEDPE